MSDPLLIAIAVGFFGVITTISTLLGAYQMQKLKQQGELAALEVTEVKTTLETSNKKTDIKLEKMAVTADATHKLVNSAMGALLQSHAMLARLHANTTHSKHDAIIADQAEERLYEHQSKQQEVDNLNPGGVPDASA